MTGQDATIAPKSLSARLRELIELDRSTPRWARSLSREPCAFAWVQALRDEQALVFKQEFWTRLQMTPAGPRIRNLRRLFAWTQRKAAAELGISVRTVIRHEQGQQYRRWRQTRWSLLLSKLEYDHMDELIASFGRPGP